MVWISLAILVSFLSWHIYMDGVPDSISSMVYELKHKWVWSVWLCAVSLTLMPVLIDTLPDYVRFVGFLTICCLLGCCITPLIRKELQGVHNMLAIMAGLLSQICVILICPWWMLAWTGMIAICGYVLLCAGEEECAIDGRGLLLAEGFCALTTYGCLII